MGILGVIAGKRFPQRGSLLISAVFPIQPAEVVSDRANVVGRRLPVGKLHGSLEIMQGIGFAGFGLLLELADDAGIVFPREPGG